VIIYGKDSIDVKKLCRVIVEIIGKKYMVLIRQKKNMLTISVIAQA